MTFYRKPTIYDIKRGSIGHFFDRESMRFFGQTLKDFKVRLVAGRVFIYAPSYWSGKLMGYTFREYTYSGLKIVPDVEKTIKGINGFFISLT